ncbi:MAG: hypothetical protein ACJ8FB_12660 [Sphingomicrobium sp.]|jgi:hypothetical protein
MSQPKSKETNNQLNVRSRFARARASQLARATGLSVTQVVEDALRAYQPARQIVRPAGLIEKAGLLVKPKGSFDVTQLQVDAELESIRSGER